MMQNFNALRVFTDASDGSVLIPPDLSPC